MTDHAPVRDDGVPSAKLLMTLGGAGAVAGLAIVAVFGWTEPTIRAYKAEVVRLAIQEVLDEPERFDTLYVVDGSLTLVPPDGSRPEEFEQVYAGYRGQKRVGYAIASGEPGFQDIVRVIFGYDRAAGSILGMRVLESKETPGLGDKIEKDQEFVTQFIGANAPLIGVTPRSAKGDPHEIDMITGATISSRTVIRIINNAIDRLDPLLQEYEEGSGP
jgi:electron transport complex protein RnfG